MKNHTVPAQTQVLRISSLEIIARCSSIWMARVKAGNLSARHRYLAEQTNALQARCDQLVRDDDLFRNVFIATSHETSAQTMCNAHYWCKYFLRRMMALWHNGKMRCVKEWHTSCVAVLDFALLVV